MLAGVVVANAGGIDVPIVIVDSSNIDDGRDRLEQLAVEQEPIATITSGPRDPSLWSSGYEAVPNIDLGTGAYEPRERHATPEDVDVSFKTRVPDSSVGTAAAAYARGQGWSHAAVLFTLTPHAGRLATSFTRRFMKSSGKVDGFMYAAGQDTFDKELATLRTLGVDVIFFAGSNPEAKDFLAGLSRIGLHVPVLGNDAWADNDFEIARQISVEAFATVRFVADEPTATEFVATFQAKYGRAPTTDEADGYDAGVLMLSAVAKDASARGSTFLANLRETTETLVPLASGPLELWHFHVNPKKGLPTVHIEGGKARFTDWASAAP